MLVQFVALALTLLGSCLIYLCSKHQKPLKRPLSPVSGYMGSGMILMALFGFSFRLAPLSAFYVWLALLMVLMTSIPFLFAVYAGRGAKHGG